MALPPRSPVAYNQFAQCWVRLANASHTEIRILPPIYVQRHFRSSTEP